MQRDFGGFDPAFVGVTLRFENENAWKRFVEITNSPVVLPVSALGTDDRFETLSLASVISHEVRHFHDFLISPYSARVFSLRLKTLINELGALPRFVDPAVNCVPVPVSSWARLDASRRAVKLGELGARGDGRPWVPPRIPEALMQAGAEVRMQIDSLVYNRTAVGDDGNLEPWQVFELSGILIQLQEIYAQYGAAELAFFIDYLMSIENGRNPYARMFQFAKSIWDEHDADFDTATGNAMAVWSILGAYNVDGWAACPSERFARLRDHLVTNGVEPWTGGVMNLFDTWSAATGLSTVVEGIRETRDILHARAESLTQNRSQLGALWESAGDHIVSVAQGVVASSDHMIGSFLADPDAYVAPHLYLDAVGRFVNPVVRYAADSAGFYLPGSADVWAKKGHLVWWALVQGGRELIFSWLVPFKVSRFEFVDRSHAAELADLFGLTDFLFAEAGRTRNDVQIPGMIFFREGKIACFDLLV